MKILITGATGFIGKTLVPYLYSKGVTDIALLVRDKNKATALFPDVPLSLITVNNVKWRDEVISYNADIVLHMATLFNTKCDAQNALKIIETNILLTTLLLEAISHTDCTHFINIGTFSEYLYGAGEYFPNNLYSASKIAVRPIIQYYQTQSTWKWINIIMYSPYGKKNEHKKVLDYMIDAMDTPYPIKFSKGEQILDFIHVNDIADFFLTLLNKRAILINNFYEFHLGTGEGHSIKKIAHLMEIIFGKKIKAQWGGMDYRKFDTMYAVAPIAKNIEILNWRAKISIVEGLNILKQDIYG